MSFVSKLDGLIGWLFKHAKATPTQAMTWWLGASVTVATTIKYLFLSPARVVDGVVVPGWTPTFEWLGFAGVVLGIEATRFLAKRHTEFRPEEVARAKVIEKNGPSPSPPKNDDVPEGAGKAIGL